MTAALPVVVIGAGRVARAVHLPLLRGMPERFAVAAVVETDPPAAARVAAEIPTPEVFDNLETAVKAGARAVLCATPWPPHAAVTHAAIDLGLPVLCEKPVSLDPNELAGLAA